MLRRVNEKDYFRDYLLGFVEELKIGPLKTRVNKRQSAQLAELMELERRFT